MNLGQGGYATTVRSDWHGGNGASTEERSDEREMRRGSLRNSRLHAHSAFSLVTKRKQRQILLVLSCEGCHRMDLKQTRARSLSA